MSLNARLSVICAPPPCSIPDILKFHLNLSSGFTRVLLTDTQTHNRHGRNSIAHLCVSETGDKDWSNQVEILDIFIFQHQAWLGGQVGLNSHCINNNVQPLSDVFLSAETKRKTVAILVCWTCSTLLEQHRDNLSVVSSPQPYITLLYWGT